MDNEETGSEGPTGDFEVVSTTAEEPIVVAPNMVVGEAAVPARNNTVPMRPTGARASHYYNERWGRWAFGIITQVATTGKRLFVRDNTCALRTIQCRVFDGAKWYMDNVDAAFADVYRMVRVKLDASNNRVLLERSGELAAFMEVAEVSLLDDIIAWAKQAKEGDKCPFNDRVVTGEDADSIKQHVSEAQDLAGGGVVNGKIKIIKFDKARLAALQAKLQQKG